MAYSKTNYVDGVTPLNAKNFNNNESALDQAVKDVASISQALVQVDDKVDGKSDIGHTHSELHSHLNKTVLDGVTSAKVTEWNNKSTFDGNYNSLTNKPTIPTVDVTKNYVDTELAKKSNTGHRHDASEIDNLPTSGGSSTVIVDNLESTSTTAALSANQGKVLDNKISILNSESVKSETYEGGVDLTVNPNLPNRMTDAESRITVLNEGLQETNTQLETKAKKTTTDNLQNQINNLVLESGGDSNLEVAQSRGKHTVLNDRVTFIEDGLTLLNGDFRRGGVTKGAYSSYYQWRIATYDVVMYEYDITLYVDEGFRFGVHILDANEIFVSDSGWITSKYTIPAYTKFRIVIAQVNEGTSGADVNLFYNSVNCTNKIYSNIKTLDSKINDIEQKINIDGIGYYGNRLSLKPTYSKSTVISAITDIYTPSISFDSAVVQGMSIYNGVAFYMMKYGGCILYDINNNKVIGEYKLDIANSEIHCNSANFSNVFLNDSDDYPVIYISECVTGSNKCFVERVTNTKSELIQTISFDNFNGDYISQFDWILDEENNRIMTYGNIVDSKHKIKTFVLPNVSNGEILLTENDVIDEWVVEDYFRLGEKIELYQGNCVNNGIVFLLDGQWKRNIIYAINITTHELVAKIDCSSWRFNEFEDIAVYNNKLYILSLVDYGRFDSITLN